MTFILSVLLALTLVLPGSAVTAKADGQGNMAVHFIDVGQGLAILVQSGGENLLYDGGNRSHADEVVQYLKNQQVETINYMISSHYDEDHLGGLVKCLDNFEVDHVLGSDYVHTSDLFNTFMNTATAHAIIVEYPSVGDTYEFGTGSFTVMAPDGISQNSNDNSVVIRLVNGNNSFMFMGDAEETSEQDMISTGMNLDCDVLSLGHHRKPCVPAPVPTWRKSRLRSCATHWKASLPGTRIPSPCPARIPLRLRLPSNGCSKPARSLMLVGGKEGKSF